MATPDETQQQRSKDDEKDDPAFTGKIKSTKIRSSFKRTWGSLGLNLQIVLLMGKGALPSAIALAAGQSSAWSNYFSSLGYVVAIMALLAMAILPRAKFVRNLAFNIFFVALGAAFTLLQIQVTVSARKSSSQSLASSSNTSKDTESLDYNASANIVSALGLFITVYIISFIRARAPQLSLPCIAYSSFTILASTYAPDIPDMAIGKSFTSRLMVAFFTGYAIAAAVSLSLYPRTSRGSVFRETDGLLKLFQGSLGAQAQYFKNLSSPLGPDSTDSNSGHASHKHKNKNEVQSQDRQSQVKAEKRGLASQDAGVDTFRDSLRRATTLYAKLNTDLGLARTEIAYGRLGPKELKEMAKHMGEILISIGGMQMVIEIVKSSEDTDIGQNEDPPLRRAESSTVFAKDDVLTRAMQGGLLHLSLVLNLAPQPKDKKQDVERKGDAKPMPGDPHWFTILQARMRISRQRRKDVVSQFCSEEASFSGSRRNPRKLRMLLHMDFVTESIATAILDAVQWADLNVKRGMLEHNRVILPPWREVKKLLLLTDSLVEGGTSHFDNSVPGMPRKIDPEHLHPSTSFEQLTDYIRVLPHFLGSAESALAFRTAVATLSIGILAFLPQTRGFFLAQRIQWSLVMISISMTGDAGSSIYNFILRVAGTTIAAITSVAIWYICDKNTAAIIVFTWLSLACAIYVVIKHPSVLRSAVISMTSIILIIGYELDVRKLGVEEATARGQPYYPIYLLAPYRLAIVVGGLAVACFWVYFPSPTTTHSALRKDVGATLFLLANFHACVFSTIHAKVSLSNTVVEQEGVSSAQLQTERRRKLYLQLATLFPQLRERAEFTRFEPTFGGKFPKACYDELMRRMQKAFTCMALMAHSANAIDLSRPDGEEEGPVHRDLRTFVSDSKILSRDLTSVLWAAAASVTNAQPLPPYLKLPDIEALRARMDRFDYEVFTAEHIHEPGCAAFAMLEVCSLTIAEEVVHIVDLVRSLVGEVDFP